MGMEGDAADLLARQCIQIAEATAKLAGSGAKNLVAFLYAMAKHPHKLQGKTKMQTFLKSCNGAAKVFPIKQEDIRKFGKLAKQYGILWAPIKEKRSGTVDIIARAEDASAINRIFERMGYSLPAQEQGKPKNAEPRTPQERDSGRRGSGSRSTEAPTTLTSMDKERPSVRGRLAHYSEEVKLKQPASPVKGPKLHTR